LISQWIRNQFLLVTHPGTIVDPEKEAEAAKRQEQEQTASNEDSMPPDSFALMVFKVDKVDHLLLMPRQRRFVSKYVPSEDRWDEREVYP